MKTLKDAAFAPELVVIEPGSFRLGSDSAVNPMYIDEIPARETSIDYGFAVGKYPVSFEDFLLFADDALPPSPLLSYVREFAAHPEKLPVVMVSWYEAKAYCEWLSDMTLLQYRLLSEAEWEYVCRAGTTTDYWWGKTFNPECANNHRASIDIRQFRVPRSFDDARKDMKYLTRIDRYGPNPWGVFDMSGNTWDWVDDVYTDPRTNPVFWVPGQSAEPFRAMRGGSWMDPELSLRSATRSWSHPSARDRIIGFRIARDL